MKILHVIANLDFTTGGPPQSCLGMASIVARRGHDITIVTTDRNLPPALRGDGPSVIDGVVIEAYPESFPRRWGTSWAMRRRLEELIPQFDVVHLHSLYLFHDMVAGDFCRRFAVPYIVRPHGTLVSHVFHQHRFRKLLVEVLFQNRVLRGAVGLHYATAEEWRLAKPYALNDHGCVVPNGVNLDTFQDLPPRSLLRERYPEIGNRRVLLYLGRLGVNKGIDVAIEAFARLLPEHDDIHLVLAGPDGGMRAAAERLVAQKGLKDRVTLTGMVTGETKLMVLAGSDILVFPSLGESFGIAVVEAAACRLPLVISDRVGIWREFAAANACVVAPPAPEAFAEKLHGVLNDRSSALSIGTRARELACNKFAWEPVGEQLERMYQQVIRERMLPRLVASEGQETLS